MPEQMRMNALRFNEACQQLDRTLIVLGEVNLQRISGMTRQELAAYRSRVKAAREHITIARQHLAELEQERKARLAERISGAVE